MADFDLAQEELSSFLDKQFKPETEPTTEDNTPTPENDEEIQQFLNGDVIEETDTVTEESSTTENIQNTTPNTPSAEDRILQLERELAATKARSQMYENALTERYTQQFAPELPKQEEKPNVVYTEQELAIEDRYEQDYGDANPYIANIAKRVANELHQRTIVPLQNELANVRSQLQSQSEFNQVQKTDVIHMQLKSVVPDIDELVRTPEWQEYIKQPDVYGSGRTIASYVQEGIQYGNVRQLAQIVDQFKQTRKQNAPQPRQVAPGRAQTTLPNTAPRRGKMLNMSDFDRATSAFQAGRLSWDKYQVVLNEFNEAMLDGRVNHNK